MLQGYQLQVKFIEKLVQDGVPVSVFLVNGIKLQGKIESFDEGTLILQNTIRQMVFKRAISTIVPSVNVDLPN